MLTVNRDTSALVNRIEAICSLRDGEKLADKYHFIHLHGWCEVRNRDVNVFDLFFPRGEAMPDIIEFDGHKYALGQCSGPAMSVVWFDRL